MPGRRLGLCDLQLGERELDLLRRSVRLLSLTNHTIM